MVSIPNIVSIPDMVRIPDSLPLSLPPNNISFCFQVRVHVHDISIMQKGRGACIMPGVNEHPNWCEGAAN